MRLILTALFPLILAAAPAATIRVPVWAPGAANITAETLHASINGETAPVVSVQGPGKELMLLVVLDLTDDLSRVEPAREALVQALSRLPAQDYIGVLSAQNGLHVLAEPTADRSIAAAAIRSQAVGGRSALLSTLETAMQLGDSVVEKSGVRLAVLYVTDSDVRNYREDYTNPVVNGGDNRDLSRRFPEALVKERIAGLSESLAATQTPLFILHLDYRTDRLNEAYQTGLLELANTTGGEAWFCRSLAEIDTSVDDAVSQLSTQWSVEVQLPAGTARQANLLLESNDAEQLGYRTRYAIPETLD